LIFFLFLFNRMDHFQILLAFDSIDQDFLIKTVLLLFVYFLNLLV